MNEWNGCEHCEAKTGKLDWNCPGCRVRFLLAEPRLEVRRALLERMRKVGSTTEIEAEMTERWAQKPKNT